MRILIVIPGCVSIGRVCSGVEVTSALGKTHRCTVLLFMVRGYGVRVCVAAVWMGAWRVGVGLYGETNDGTTSELTHQSASYVCFAGGELIGGMEVADCE